MFFATSLAAVSQVISSAASLVCSFAHAPRSTSSHKLKPHEPSTTPRQHRMHIWAEESSHLFLEEFDAGAVCVTVAPRKEDGRSAHCVACSNTSFVRVLLRSTLKPIVGEIRRLLAKPPLCREALSREQCQGQRRQHCLRTPLSLRTRLPRPL